MDYLRDYQKRAIESSNQHKKCLINMWCGTGKTDTFTIDIFIQEESINVIVFPSLQLVQQYYKEYILSLEEPFQREFKKYKCLAFCSENENEYDNDSKLKRKKSIPYTTDKTKLITFFKDKNKKIIMVTYQSFEKFINSCISENININKLIYDEAHHIVGDKIQNVIFNNDALKVVVDKTRFYTATPVNKNGITMYDKDDPDNSDCGVLAYEYLYYQAIKDNICKVFETQIMLYTQKSEYTNKYQPIFESIIRTCLSGKYNFWNVLTYHTFVEKSDTQNTMISFVKEFASPENKILLKKQFTKIQDEEFPHTKNLYKVEDVNLYELHSNCKDRDDIIKQFNQKVEGRIYILSSCCILNEGINTKWANMSVPINPTNSIVKESQRIGRLSRTPEENMPPAIVLIPCQIDILKYTSIDTPEQRNQMIREELSESGNFNTALNVISAFQYQYDPDIYEECLRYPNMYSPNEVKSNLENHGLHVEESQGTLIDNLKYVSNNNINEEGHDDQTILNKVAKQRDKTIEIHTQNYDQPITYINEEATDDEPLRLFYCEDEDIYLPIVNKEKNIPRKSITPPKKRQKLFNVHTHSDLEVLWNIRENSIDLSKEFSQGILDVNVSYNEKKWKENYDLLKEYNDTPSFKYVTTCGVKLGSWCGTQRRNKKKNKLSQEHIDLLEKIPNWFWEQDLDEQWNKTYTLLKEYNDTPSSTYVTTCGVKLGSWCTTQRQDKKKNKLSQEHIDLLEKIPNWYWEQDEQWKENYDLLKEYNDTPSSTYITTCGVKLGMWCQNQRQNKKKNKLSQEHIDILEKIPNWFWEQDLDEQWKENYDLLKEYNDTPSNTYETTCGVKLGSWCSRQRQDKKKNKLSQERIDLLEKIPNWYWEQDEQWNKTYTLLKEYNDTPSKTYETTCGVKLGMWCQNQRQNKKKNKLSQEHIDLLEKIPNWYWEQDLDEQWNKTYTLLKEYNDTPSKTYETTCGVKLGMWCQNQRQNKKKNKLSQEHIDLLEKIPNWYWEQDLDEQWNKTYTLLKEYNDTPSKTYETTCGVKLGNWCSKQKQNKKKNKLSQEHIDLLEKIPNWYWEQDEQWNKTYTLLKEYNDTPSQTYVTTCGVKLGKWCQTQKTNKKKNKLSQERIDLLEKIPNWYWCKKDMSKPEIKPHKKTGSHKPPPKSVLSELHKQYKTMTSYNIHEYFEQNPEKWKYYHEISKENERSFPTEEIPRNKMIKYLEKLPGKKQKVIADLGCGFAEINKHFKDNPRFKFHNFDHYSHNDLVISRDIYDTQLEDYSVDIVIMSLTMWGSNCNDYILEAYRILDKGGTLLIAEPYKRWNKELNEHGKPINRLVNLLEENNFTIQEKYEGKFMFIECSRYK